MNSLDAVLITHPADIVIYANSAAEELFGYTEEEIYELSWKGLVDNFDPRLPIFLEELSRSGKAKSELTFEKKDGSKFPGEISTSFVDENRNAQSISVVRDITERKKSEFQLKKLLGNVEKEKNRLSALINSINDEIWFADTDKIFTLANPSALKEFKMVSDEDISVEELALSLEVYRSDGSSRPVEEAPPLRALEGEVVKNQEEIIRTPATNELRYRQVSASPVKDKNGNILGTVSVVRDITELKLAEEALRESEDRYRNILENIQDAYIRADKEGNVIMASPSAAVMYRFDSPQEMIGISAFSLYKNPEDRDSLLLELNKHGKVEDYESEALRKNGSSFLVSLNSQFHYDYSGEIQGTEAFVRDITARKGIEASLRESEERLRLAQTRGNVGVWDWNTITNELSFTPELEQLYGLQPGTIKTYQDWRQLTHPDDIEKIEAEREEKIANHKSFDVEFRIIHESGDLHWLSAKGGAIYNDEGEVVRVLGINTDITDRKRNEELLRDQQKRLEIKNKELQALFDYSEASMAIFDAQPPYTVLAHNKYYQGLWAEPFKSETLVGKNLLDYVPLVEVSGVMAVYDEVVRTREVKTLINFPYDGMESGRTWWNWHLSPVIHDDKVVALVHMAFDVTNEISALERADKSIAELKRSNKELEQFAYVSSHDLQEPLRMVALFTQLLGRRYKGKLDDEADEYIGFIVEGAHRMKYLIDDLLSFSQLNTQAKEFESIDLEIILDTALFNLKASVDKTNAQITHDPLPVITGDPSQIVQVFQNLIANGLKFNDNNTPEIHISAQKNENEWVFQIRDNGIGIAPEYQDKIFEVFKRLNVREKYPGTGIGLAICQKIIERHGGRVWVESELEKGSIFYFTLPE